MPEWSSPAVKKNVPRGLTAKLGKMRSACATRAITRLLVRFHSTRSWAVTTSRRSPEGNNSADGTGSSATKGAPTAAPDRGSQNVARLPPIVASTVPLSLKVARRTGAQCAEGRTAVLGVRDPRETPGRRPSARDQPRAVRAELDRPHGLRVVERARETTAGGCVPNLDGSVVASAGDF